jgi:NAD(P)H-dependent flavin oxidoreductase YrpB (nitropropane dioxygenase family)
VTGLDGVRRAEVETMLPEGMRTYGEVCGWTLARAHARSGDPLAVAAYLGGSPSFDEAVREFAESYADQNERDHQSLLDAIASGRITAEAGV